MLNKMGDHFGVLGYHYWSVDHRLRNTDLSDALSGGLLCRLLGEMPAVGSKQDQRELYLYNWTANA